MDKPVNNRAWFLVLPVLVLVGAFPAPYCPTPSPAVLRPVSGAAS